MDAETLPAEMLPAGWIAYGDGGLIWGVGRTQEIAESDAARCAADACVQLDWSGVYCARASAALLARVVEMGGDVRWHLVNIDGRAVADVRR